MRLSISSMVLNFFGIEQDQVGGRALPDLPAVVEAELFGGQLSHAADGVF